MDWRLDRHTHHSRYPALKCRFGFCARIQGRKGHGIPEETYPNAKQSPSIWKSDFHSRFPIGCRGCNPFGSRQPGTCRYPPFGRFFLKNRRIFAHGRIPSSRQKNGSPPWRKLESWRSVQHGFQRYLGHPRPRNGIGGGHWDGYGIGKNCLPPPNKLPTHSASTTDAAIWEIDFPPHTRHLCSPICRRSPPRRGHLTGATPFREFGCSRHP